MAAWQPPKPNGHQDLIPERWERQDVADRGVILAVYRGWVVPSDPAHRLPDWHPGRLAGLWQALFDEEPDLQAAVAEHLEETTSSFNRRIKGWLEQGSAVGVDAELPRELRMLLDELGQQVLLPGGDRRSRPRGC